MVIYRSSSEDCNRPLQTDVQFDDMQTFSQIILVRVLVYTEAQIWSNDNESSLGLVS